MYPKITLVAFEARQPRFIFVSVPNERGRYVRTDASVALVACGHCKSIPGEPCKSGPGRYGGGTHAVRREAAERERRRKENELADAEAVLRGFVNNFGHLERFRSVVDAISGVLHKQAA